MTEQAETSRVAVTEGDAAARPSGLGPLLERPVAPRTSKRRRSPPQSEIAVIADEPVIVERTVKKKGYRFYAQAVGPQGRYVAGVSPGFEGQVLSSDYIVKTPDSEAALNALLSQLWSEGWQPTSWGRSWYDFRLRRAVLRSDRSASLGSSPRAESSEAD